MGPSTPWIKLLGLRQTWAFAVSKFLTDPIWWFFLFWLPSYFSAKFHLDLSHLGLPLIIVYSASTIGSIGGGWLPAPFRRLGLSLSQARLGAMLFCACLVVPVFLVNYLHSEWVAIALLSLAAAAHQGWSANLFTTASDMFPRSAVGSVTGIGGMAGAVGGALLAIYAGHVLQLTHSYASLFAIAASAYLLALAHHEPARPRTEESGVSRMSLYCATGSVDTDLSPRAVERSARRKAWPSSARATACSPCLPIRAANTPAPAS